MPACADDRAHSWSTEAANSGTCGPSTASQPAFTPFAPLATSKVVTRFLFDVLDG